ncbi:hypothetical protein [Pseudomonas sp. PD9R]|uniref:hypothetical protein n=1 Tax=Pseudomonas sp. PD9R TaxID=2853534 RepID=UPI001C45AAB7|nr:hypothetical protein [Pseudomonas sp. PD9R]MBV6824532.1 hypothetical protein [Pseudomonas sp. PD9R]
MANSTTVTSPQPFNELNNLWWIVTVALVLLGAMVTQESWIAGLMLIAFGAVVSPFGFSRILSWLNAGDPLHCRVIIVLVALASSTYVLSEHTARVAAEAAEESHIQAIANARAAEAKQTADAAAQLSATQAYFAANRTSVLSEFAAAVDGKNLATAKAIRDRFILAVQDPEFDLILNRYVSLREDVERAEAEKTRLAKIAELTKQLSTVGATDYDQAFTIYAQLVSLEPTNKLYKQKLDRFVKARDEKAAKDAAALAASVAKAERQKKIEAQFSGYSGVHYSFERMIKDAMNDPDSYDHVETKYIDKGTFIRVFLTFRGRNGFGGMVKNTKVADFTIGGDFLREIE